MEDIFTRDFFVDLEDSLAQPSAREIRGAIQKHCEGMRQSCRFLSTETPVTFRMDDTVYTSEVLVTPGGYSVKCVEKA